MENNSENLDIGALKALEFGVFGVDRLYIHFRTPFGLWVSDQCRLCESNHA